MKEIIVDRIENGLAVCEADGQTVDIPLVMINGTVREGDVLRESGDGANFLVSAEETEQRRSAIQDRFDRLKLRNKLL